MATKGVGGGQWVLRRLERFADDSGGNVAILFAVALVVLLLSIGAAIDVGRWLHARDQTIAAVDAALLAGGRALQTNNKDEAAAIAAAQKFYDQNVTTRLPVTDDTVSFEVADGGTSITASGEAYIKTPFLRLASIEKLPLISKASTEFSKAELAVGGSGGQSIEVSLILDITGSMSGSKIEDLKDAAQDLIDIVVWDDQSEYTSKVALVPYAAGVNVDDYADTVRGTIRSGTKTVPGYKKYKFDSATTAGRYSQQQQQATGSITTCVSERTGTASYTDASPVNAKVGLNYQVSSSNPCPSEVLVPLSSDKQTLKNKIERYSAGGSTAGQIGIAWGWYTLSPNWSGVFTGTSRPESYSKLTELGPKGQPLLKKIAVLMTDGDFNTAYCNGVIARDSGSGSGSDADHIDCNATNGGSNSQALKLCTAMKDAGITIYTVGFDVGNLQQAKKLMNDCATDPGKVYITDNGEQLKQAFRDIALKLSSLYLSK